MKIKDIYLATTALNKLLESPSNDIRFTYDLTKYISNLNKEIETSNNVREKLIKELWLKLDGNDTEESINKFNEKFNIIIEQEIDVNKLTIYIDQLDNLWLTGNDLLLIEPLFEIIT